MGSEWNIVTIAEIASRTAMGPFGSNIKTDNFVEEGVPVIRGSNLNYGRFNDACFVYLTPDKADELSNSNALPGDIVFTHRGTLGQVGIIPREPYNRYVVSQSQMVLGCDRALAEPLFVYYFFKSPEGQHRLLMNTSQTGVPAISQPLTSLRSVKIALPPFVEQQAIAAILGALDDKIELNRKMNQTLEEMAQAIFKSWFVDFDPVRYKAAGQQPPGLAPHIAELFPESFLGQSLDIVPTDWHYTSLTSFVDILGGGTPKTSVAEYWDGETPWFSMTDAPSEADIFVINTEKKITLSGVENSSTKILPEGTTIITARGTIGKLALVGVPMAMNQSCYGLRTNAGNWPTFLYFTLKNVVGTLKQNAHGSVFDTITRATFKQTEFVHPCKVLLDAFELVLNPFMTRIKSNLVQNLTLSNIRDTLLPKLISGELRIPDAERIASSYL